ncbi:MAG: hypothetical protein JSU70_05535, partial [Phycisphaerales bacterium]
PVFRSMSSGKRTIWSVCTVVLLVVCATCLGAFMWHRSGNRQAEAQSFKIEVDTATRATPRRLAAPLEITNISTYDALAFDASKQDYSILTYELSKPAWVRIRLVARREERLVLRTLVDWSERNVGKNSERWDGRDASGYLVDRQRCPCYFRIAGDSAAHAAHDRSKCGDMLLQITESLPGTVLSGHVVIRVTLAGMKQGYVAEAGGTLRAHVDYVLSAERRFAGPATSFEWQWDTATVDNGYHMITLNVDDGNDHIGTVTTDVYVRN